MLLQKKGVLGQPTRATGHNTAHTHARGRHPPHAPPAPGARRSPRVLASRALHPRRRRLLAATGRRLPFVPKRACDSRRRAASSTPPRAPRIPCASPWPPRPRAASPTSGHGATADLLPCSLRPPSLRPPPPRLPCLPPPRDRAPPLSPCAAPTPPVHAPPAGRAERRPRPCSHLVAGPQHPPPRKCATSAPALPPLHAPCVAAGAPAACVFPLALPSSRCAAASYCCALAAPA